MTDFTLLIFVFITLVLAIVHSAGEALYKFANESLLKLKSIVKSQERDNRALIFFLGVFGFSIFISLFVKVLYGILLGSNSFSITSGLFLGSISIFSVIIGKIFFFEKISHNQYIGICLISLGIILVV